MQQTDAQRIPRILVVIESPYAGNVIRNEEYARDAMRDSLIRGEAPIASHLLYTQPGILDDTKPDERNLGMAAGFSWGRLSSLIAVYTDLGVSEGMKRGIERYSSAGIKVEFRSLEKWNSTEND